MDYKHIILVSSIVILSVIYQVNSLKCYECSSATEKGCGTTWEVSAEDAKMYIKTCEGDNAACRKLETTDTPKQQPIVVRACWNASGADLEEDFFSCTAMGKLGESCYCKSEPDADGNDGPPCNGRQPLLASWELLFALVILVCLSMFRTPVL
ncbi:hypothetical protein ACF0H5_015754 [Mactra antiquata]